MLLLLVDSFGLDARVHVQRYLHAHDLGDVVEDVRAQDALLVAHIAVHVDGGGRGRIGRGSELHLLAAYFQSALLAHLCHSCWWWWWHCLHGESTWTLLVVGLIVVFLVASSKRRRRQVEHVHVQLAGTFNSN